MSTCGLRANDVCSKYNFSKPSLYRWIKAGLWPPGILVGPGVRIWLESDIEKHLAAKAAQQK